MKKFYMPELKRPLIEMLSCNQGTLGLLHGFAGSQYRVMFLCQKAGVRQLVFCVGCSFSARMHSTTVSTMSGRV